MGRFAQYMEPEQDQVTDNVYNNVPESTETPEYSRIGGAVKGAIEGTTYGPKKAITGLGNIAGAFGSDTFVQGDNEDKSYESEEPRGIINRLEQAGRGMTQFGGGVLNTMITPVMAIGGGVIGAVAPEVGPVAQSAVKGIENTYDSMPDNFKKFVSWGDLKNVTESAGDVIGMGAAKGVAKGAGFITKEIGKTGVLGSDTKGLVGGLKKTSEDVGIGFLGNPMGKKSKNDFLEDAINQAKNKGGLTDLKSADRDLAKTYLMEGFEPGTDKKILEQTVSKIDQIGVDLYDRLPDIKNLGYKDLQNKLFSIYDEAKGKQTIETDSSLVAYKEVADNMLTRIKNNVASNISSGKPALSAKDFWDIRKSWDYDMASKRKTFDWSTEGAADRVRAGIMVRNKFNEFIDEATGGIYSPELKRMSKLYDIQDNTALRMWANASKREGSMMARAVGMGRDIGMPASVIGAGAIGAGATGMVVGGLAVGMYKLYKSTWFKSRMMKTLDDVANLIKKPPETMAEQSNLMKAMKDPIKGPILAKAFESDNALESVNFTRKSLDDPKFIENLADGDMHVMLDKMKGIGEKMSSNALDYSEAFNIAGKLEEKGLYPDFAKTLKEYGKTKQVEYEGMLKNESSKYASKDINPKRDFVQDVKGMIANYKALDVTQLPEKLRTKIEMMADEVGTTASELFTEARDIQAQEYFSKKGMSTKGKTLIPETKTFESNIKLGKN